MELDRAKMICKDLGKYYTPNVTLIFRDMGFVVGGTTSWFSEINTRIEIEMNINFLLQKDENEVIDTILHEIAHALDIQIRGESFHDKIWKAIAQGIGCTGDRLYQGSLIPKGVQYVYACPKCGRTVIQSWKRITSKSACGPCCKAHNNGKYSNEFELKLRHTYINA